MKPTNQILETFLEDNSFINLIKSNTCFKSKPGSCIDLILTNKPRSFQNTIVMETGISDQHALVCSFFETTFTKMPPIKLKYRNYKQFTFYSFKKLQIFSRFYSRFSANYASCILRVQ